MFISINTLKKKAKTSYKLGENIAKCKTYTRLVQNMRRTRFLDKIEAHMPHLRAQLQQKNTATLQNKYHPESSENQAVWKSDNQGFKAATFIQTDRKGRDAERHGDMV